MDELLALCAQVHDLTAALQTALLAEDYVTFARIVQGRTPLLERCIALFEAVTPAERAQVEPHLRDMVEANALIVQTGEEWLRATRQKLIRMQQGVQVMGRYRAPLGHLAALKPGI